MARSQNGWTVLDGYGDARLVNIPKIIGKVRGEPVSTIFADLVEVFDQTVEDVELGRDDWGFAPRPIRGGTTPSNHASGTAIDLNAQRHGLGLRGTFSAAQVSAIRRLLDRYRTAAGKPVVRWGGDYTGRADEMHFEIVGSISECREVAARLSAPVIELAGSVNKAPAPKPVPADAHVRPLDEIREICLRAGHGPGSTPLLIERYQHRQIGPVTLKHDRVWGPATEAHYQWTRKLQETMNRWKGYTIGVDGDYRDGTADRVRDVQRRNSGVGGAYRGYDIDGIAGPVFCAMLGIPSHP